MRWLTPIAVGLAIVCAGSSAQASEPAFKPLMLGGQTVKWQKRAPSGRTEVTYALVTGRWSLPGARNCPLLDPLATIADVRQLDGALLQSEVAAAFAMWENVAAISFTEVADPETADILIGAQVTPAGRAFADVMVDSAHEAVLVRITAATAGADPQARSITRAAICLNPTHPWKLGFDGNLMAYDLRYTMAHEVGHAIGLDHPAATGSLMGYRYDERTAALTAGDILGAISLYGSGEAGDRTAQPNDRLVSAGAAGLPTR